MACPTEESKTGLTIEKNSEADYFLCSFHPSDGLFFFYSNTLSFLLCFFSVDGVCLSYSIWRFLSGIHRVSAFSLKHFCFLKSDL